MTTGEQYHRVGILSISDVEWDPNKAFINVEKHGIAFNTAVRLFQDPKRIEFTPPQERQGELRWKTTGLADGVLTTIIFTWRDERMRFISARKANRRERRQYREGAPV